MDFILRCNSLKCRDQLTERAVVTTCSHIFCSGCSDSLGLSAPPGVHRTCPACQTSLPNPDDAVSTQLNPTEDYKTSVLSGLSPSTIVECAGRGLAFWSYQSTQEIVYQEYLAKSLTDKFGRLNAQMDKIIHDANSEIDMLNQQISMLHIDKEKLQSENTNLVAAFREKSRKHQQTQELYDRLKRKEMTAATRSAAFESVDEVLGNTANQGSHTNPPESHFPTTSRTQQNYDDIHQNLPIIEHDYHHGRKGSGGSGGHGGRMLPPPLRRAAGYENQTCFNGTPQHRTQLGAHLQARNSSNPAVGNLQNHTPSQRIPLGALNASNINRSNIGRYGLSAGVKVGRQQVSQRNTGPGESASNNHLSPHGIFQPNEGFR